MNLGLHDFDGELPDITAVSQNRFSDVLRSAREQLDWVEKGMSSHSDWADYQTLRHKVESLWPDAHWDHPERHDPNVFNGVISESLLIVVRGQFGTVASRARDALSRLRQVPGYLSDALKQLDNPPRLFVEMALEPIFQTVLFLQQEVPATFDQAPSTVRAEIAGAREEAARAYQSFSDGMKTEVCRRPMGLISWAAPVTLRGFHDALQAAGCRRCLCCGNSCVHTRNSCAMNKFDVVK